MMIVSGETPLPVFINSEVFIFSTVKNHPLRGPCRDVLRAALEMKISAVFNTDVISEVIRFHSDNNSREMALHAGRLMLALAGLVLPIAPDDIALALDLMAEHPGLILRDSLHAATMIRSGIDTIISTETGFDCLPDLSRKDPHSFLESEKRSG